MTSSSFIFFDTNKKDSLNKDSYLLQSPEKVIESRKKEDFFLKVRDIEKEITRGKVAAGFFSYEAFAPSIKDNSKENDFPLLRFAIFPELNKISEENKIKILSGQRLSSSQPNSHKATNFRYELEGQEFAKAFNKIKEKIRQGETFETNFTFKCFFELLGDPLDFYLKLRSRQKVAYSSFLSFPDFSVLSFSPELFFRIRQGKITMKPMKGTIKRGNNVFSDLFNYLRLKNSRKNRAENSMIVDLVRNDLGRISQLGSVKTKKLFSLEKLETLWQMTSEVQAELRKNLPLEEILKAIFPCGSITGAPKIRTMEIISQLEKTPRKVYCGAIGFFSQSESCFSVPIRTVLLSQDESRGKEMNQFQGEMGIGSGIVADSDLSQEYEECILKSKFIFWVNSSDSSRFACL